MDSFGRAVLQRTSLLKLSENANEKTYHPQRVRRRTCRLRCGNSGCIPAPGPCAVAGGERALGLLRGSAWPQTRPSGGSPGSWTSRGPGSGQELRRPKALRDKRDKREDGRACERRGGPMLNRGWEGEGRAGKTNKPGWWKRRESRSKMRYAASDKNTQKEF